MSAKYLNFTSLKTFVRQVLLFSLICIFAFSSVPGISQALSDEQKNIFASNIDYFDLACSGSTASSSGTGGGGPVYMLGDSITVGVQADLEKEFKAIGVNVEKINGVGGRSFEYKGAGPTNGMDGLEQDKESIKKASSVIIAMGTNREGENTGQSDNFKKYAQKALDKVREFNPNAKIYWVNLFSTSPIVNTELYNNVIASLSGIEIIDTTKANIALQRDKIHPSWDGYKQLAKVIAKSFQSGGSNSSGAKGSDDLNLSEIAQANDIHSIVVRKLGTDQIQQFNASDSPNAVASTLKLIIVDVALSNGVSIGDRVKIDGVAYYGSDDAIKKNQTVSIEKAITEALGAGSSNNGANAIIKAAGGPDKVNDLAKRLGYQNTSITSYFKDTSSSQVKNNSTADDVTKAMNKLYSGDREGDKVAQAALKQSSSANGGGYNLDSEANKWGLRNNPPSRGNSAVFKVGDAKYIVTMYTNSSDKSHITKATKAVVDKIDGSSFSQSGSASTGNTTDTACCISGGSTVLTGNGNAEKIWNFFVQEVGFNDTQTAAVLGNLEQESGLSPTIVNPRSGAFGIGQWMPKGRKVDLDAYAKSKGKPDTDLGIQLEFMKKELEGSPYKSTVFEPMKNAKSLAEATRIWLEKFEIPCTPGPGCDPEMNIRLPKAVKFLHDFGGGGGASTSTDTSSDDSGASSCGNASGGSFSAIDFANKGELVQKILANNNIAFGNFGSAASQKQDVKDCLTETTLVGLESMAEQSAAKILVNAMARDHGGCTGGGGSLHNSGRAIDIGYYGNGNPLHTADGDKLYSYLYRNRKELKIDELIWKNPPSGMQCVKNLEPTNCYTTYAKDINDHYHHIHVGFK